MHRPSLSQAVALVLASRAQMHACRHREMGVQGGKSRRACCGSNATLVLPGHETSLPLALAPDSPRGVGCLCGTLEGALDLAFGSSSGHSNAAVETLPHPLTRRRRLLGVRATAGHVLCRLRERLWCRTHETLLSLISLGARLVTHPAVT